MANGTLITDYLSAASGAAGTPSLGDNASEAALRYRTDGGILQVWDGSAWQTPAGGALQVVSVNSNGFLPANADITLVDAGGSDVSLAMQNPATDRMLRVVKKSDTSRHIVRLFPNASETFDGAPLFVIVRPNAAILLASDGTNWRVVAEYEGVDSLLSGNPRYPWPNGSASDWRASFGATPGAWTLDSGLNVAYPNNGLARLTWTNDTTVRKAVASLTGSTIFDVIMRGRFFSGVNPKIQIGFSLAGNASDMDGFQFEAASFLKAMVDGTPTDLPNTLISYNLFQDWQWLRARLDTGGNTLDVYCSTDGLSWGRALHASSTLAPTKLVMAITGAVEPASCDEWFELDFLLLGNTTPAGQ